MLGWTAEVSKLGQQGAWHLPACKKQRHQSHNDNVAFIHFLCVVLQGASLGLGASQKHEQHRSFLSRTNEQFHLGSYLSRAFNITITGYPCQKRQSASADKLHVGFYNPTPFQNCQIQAKPSQPSHNAQIVYTGPPRAGANTPFRYTLS